MTCGAATTWSLENVSRLAAGLADDDDRLPPCGANVTSARAVELGGGGRDGLGAVLTRTVALALSAAALALEPVCRAPVREHVALSSVFLELSGPTDRQLYCHPVRSLDLGDDGVLYVSSFTNDHVLRVGAQNGSLLGKFGNEDELDCPEGLALGEAMVRGDGRDAGPSPDADVAKQGCITAENTDPHIDARACTHTCMNARPHSRLHSLPHSRLHSRPHAYTEGFAHR